MTTRTELLERAPLTILPEGGQRVLCAVSGGLDSMCLLFMLDSWCRERGGQVIAAHFNHRIRGEAADRDEEFVRAACEKWGIPLTVGRGDVRAFAQREDQTLEEAARTLRYAFLRQTATAEGCERIYTAHHAGDNAETVLLNLIRGTGLRGLTGMDWRRGSLFRPLLGVTREELADYAARWSIPHAEDETNTDPDAASRNFLRLRVMPLLRELNPRAVEHINQAAGQLRTADRFLEEEARRRTAHVELREGRAALAVDEVLGAPEAVRPRMILRLFDLLNAGRKDIGAVHLESILNMMYTDRGGESSLSLPHGVTARCRRRQLILEPRPQALTEVPLIPGKSLRWGDYTLTLTDRPEGAGLALGWRGPPGESPVITAAPCPPGERLTLPGSRGGRTVKRLCLDNGVSLEERERLPALRLNGELAAVWRLGVDVKFLPEGKIVRFIKITKL